MLSLLRSTCRFPASVPGVVRRVAGHWCETRRAGYVAVRSFSLSIGGCASLRPALVQSSSWHKLAAVLAATAAVVATALVEQAEAAATDDEREVPFFWTLLNKRPSSDKQHANLVETARQAFYNSEKDLMKAKPDYKLMVFYLTATLDILEGLEDPTDYANVIGLLRERLAFVRLKKGEPSADAHTDALVAAVYLTGGGGAQTATPEAAAAHLKIVLATPLVVPPAAPANQPGEATSAAASASRNERTRLEVLANALATLTDTLDGTPKETLTAYAALCEPIMLHTLAIREALFGETHRDTRESYLALMKYMSTVKLDDGRAAFYALRVADARTKELGTTENPHLILLYSPAVFFLLHAKQYERAKYYTDECFRLCRTLAPDVPHYWFMANFNAVLYTSEMKQKEEMVQYLEAAVHHARQGGPNVWGNVINARLATNLLIDVYGDTPGQAQAKALCKEYIAVLKRVQPRTAVIDREIQLIQHKLGNMTGPVNGIDSEIEH